MKVPKDLGVSGAAYYRKVARNWRLDQHQPAILHRACRCLDLIEQAEAELTQTGLTVTGRSGQQRPAPAIAVIRDMTILFARLVRELGLSGAAADPERPPTLTGRYAGRK